MPSDNNSVRPERTDDVLWQSRENQRFLDGTYQPVSWRTEAFWQTFYGHGLSAGHMAHVSTVDPSMIAFTESDAKGRQDRQTRMKPGRYLHRFFSTVLTPKQISFYAEWWAKGRAPEVPDDAEKIELHMATTEDEIVAVYKDGPASCMRNSRSVRVYAAGDLAIAWTEDTRDGFAGETAARALCWPAQKVYGRVYPTPNRYSEDGYPSEEASQAVGHRLEKMLRDQGYTSIRENSSCFDGAKLLKEDYGNGWVMPYIDGGGDACGGAYGVSERGRFWVMAREDYDHQCSETGGTLDSSDDDDDDDDYGMVTCERCDDRVDEDETSTVITSLNASGRARYRESWCYGCRERNTFHCTALSDDVSDDIDSFEVLNTASYHGAETVTVCAERIMELVADGWLQVLPGGVLVRNRTIWMDWPKQLPRLDGSEGYENLQMHLTEHLARLAALRGVSIYELAESHNAVCDDGYLPDEHRSDYEPELPLEGGGVTRADEYPVTSGEDMQTVAALLETVSFPTPRAWSEVAGIIAGE